MNTDFIDSIIDNGIEKMDKNFDREYRKMELSYELLRYQLDNNYNMMSSILEIFGDDKFVKK